MVVNHVRQGIKDIQRQFETELPRTTLVKVS